MPAPTETNFVRPLVIEYLIGNGCDIGCGGGKVKPDAIGIDINKEDAGCEADIKADAIHLPYPDNHFDYVYSSHLIEDFADTLAILFEWIRVLRDGGIFVLAVPDQARYEWQFAGREEMLNSAHKHTGMGYWYIKYWMLRFCINTGYWAEELYSYQPTGQNYNAIAVWRVFKGQVEKE